MYDELVYVVRPIKGFKLVYFLIGSIRNSHTKDVYKYYRRYTNTQYCVFYIYTYYIYLSRISASVHSLLIIS